MFHETMRVMVLGRKRLEFKMPLMQDVPLGTSEHCPPLRKPLKTNNAPRDRDNVAAN